MKTVTLPAWMEPLAEQFAKTHCDHVLEIEEDDAKYKKEFDKAKKKFLQEAYEESLVPHMKNPTTEKASNLFSVFDKKIFGSDNSFISKRSDNNEATRIELGRQFKGAVLHLTSLYLKADKEFRSKRGASASSLEFTTAMKKDPDARRVVEIDRYYRSAVLALIMSYLEPVLSMDAQKLKEFVVEGLKDEPLSSLQKKETRLQFYDTLTDALKSLRQSNVLDEVKKGI